MERCQVHNRRNVKAYVREKHFPELDHRLGVALEDSDYEVAKKSLEDTAN
jgi:hypothetical protein